MLALIQHHPGRAHLLPGLQEALRPLDCLPVVDLDPDGRVDPWRAYKACLARVAAHTGPVLVVQDDACPVDGLGELAPALAEAQPGRLLVLCVCSNLVEARGRMLQAQGGGHPWWEMVNPRWVPVVAAIWPPQLAADVLAWVTAENYTREFTADDEMVGQAVRGLQVAPLASIPSLVCHDPDHTPSLVDPRNDGRQGRDTMLPPWAGYDWRTVDWRATPY